MCCTFAHLDKSSTHNMFHRPLLDVPDPCLSFCSTSPPFTPTPLPMTGIRRPSCATPPGGIAVWPSGRIHSSHRLEPQTCIDVVSSEHTTINCSSRSNSFNTDEDDLTTTVAASEPPDMKEVGHSSSPLFFQEREASSNPFCVSGFLQQAASGSQRYQQRASSSG